MRSAVSRAVSRRTLVLAALFALCTGPLLVAQDPPITSPRNFDAMQKGVFSHATSGDSITLKIAGRDVAVRLAGINAGADDPAAIDYLERLLGAEEVYVEWSETPAAAKDVKSRSAFVFRAPDGLHVNLELIRQGYTKAQPAMDGDDGKLFHFYEHRAKLAKKGIWAPGESTAKVERKSTPSEKPSQAKEAEKSGQGSTAADNETVYVTASGKKYHRSGCKYLTDTARTITLSEARKTYEPCAHCKPPK